MAKIKINGDSSGYVELAAPNAAHNNTLELGPGTKILTDKNTHTGNIGIGTDNPQAKLQVNGTITQIGKSGAAASTAIDPLSSFVLNDVEARLQLCSTNTGNNASGIILSNESKHFVLHQKGVDLSNRFDIGYLDNASPTDINNQSTARLTITTGGNVGINETAPDRTLHVNSGAADTALKLESTDTEVSLELADNTGSSYIGGGGSYLNFYSGGNERLRVTSGGNVGINQTSPDKLLHISSSSAPTIRIENTSTGAQVGNLVGSLEFEGQDNNAAGVRAKIDAEYRGVGAATAIKIHTAWENETTLYESAYFTKPTIKFTTNNVERLRIDSSGSTLLGHTTASNLAGGFTKALAIEGTGAANSSIGLVRNANDDNPPYIYLGKSRGTSAGSNTAATNGDHLGMVNFAGSRGTGAFGDSVNLRVNAEGNFSSSSTPGRFSVWTTPVNSTSPLNSFQINSAGAITAPRNVTWSYSRSNNGASWGSSSSGLTYGGRQYRSPLPLFGASATNYDTHNALSTFTSGGGTGIKFTAPAGGKYLVMLNMSSVKNEVDTDWGSIGLMRNTTAQASTGSLDYMLDTMYFPNSTSTGNQLGWGGSVIISLSQNDYIVPYTMSVEHFSSDNQFYFQGYLLG